MVFLDRSGLLSTTKQWCAEDGARESYATSVSANGSPLFRGPQWRTPESGFSHFVIQHSATHWRSNPESWFKCPAFISYMIFLAAIIYMCCQKVKTPLRQAEVQKKCIYKHRKDYFWVTLQQGCRLFQPTVKEGDISKHPAINWLWWETIRVTQSKGTVPLRKDLTLIL